MKCTACGNLLREVKVEGIAVDVCRRGCGGIWFDAFELQKVDEMHESAGERLLDIERDEKVKVDRSRKRMCPKCGNMPMLRHFFSVKQEVEVDECPACGGYWLDFGELARIRHQFENEEEREKAAEEYFEEIFGKKLSEMREEGEEKLKKARKIAHVFRFICPSYYIPGKQDWGAF
ncbi:MAG: zf-TFIIB domain-containing protein [Candidatus Glassbacteria bacterium]